MILSGKTRYFIGAIWQIIKKGKYSKWKKNKIEKILVYFEKRKEYMKYNEYIERGYPIGSGSGVIEGACRSFVKDRIELAGMRRYSNCEFYYEDSKEKVALSINQKDLHLYDIGIWN